jgi:hypothetical protein
MTAAQKAAKEKFSKAIAYRTKTGVSLKEAFAHVYGKKVGAVKKKTASKKKTTVKKAAPKKKVAPKKVAPIRTTVKKVNSVTTVSGVKNKKNNYNLKSIGALYEFFEVQNLTDIDSLKKMYFKLAKRYHPDAGGTKEEFQRLQKEYEGLFKTIMSGSNLSSNDIKTEIELDENLRKAVDAIIGIQGINLELVGKWIWVSGSTYPIRNELKMAGFQFAPVKKMWYYKGIESAGRGKLTIDEIRKKYGSQAIQKESVKKIQGIGEYISPVKKRKFYLSLKKALKALDNRIDKKIIISGIIKNIH